MNVRRKLIIANLLMVFIPILCAVVLCAVFIIAGGSAYWRSLERMFSEEAGMYTAQGIIYENRERLLQYEHWDSDNRDEFMPLINQLSEIGYHYQISHNDHLVLINLSEKDISLLQELAGKDYDQMDSINLSNKNTTIVKNTFRSGDKKIEVIAINSGGGQMINANNTILTNYLRHILMLFTCGVIISLISANVIFARWIMKRIISPLRELSCGAEAITEGNFDFKISYTHQDDIGKVCRDFNRMSQFLKKTVQDQMKNEMVQRNFIADISHDLRTPLTSIKGYIEGLLDGLADTSEKRERYYKAIQTRTTDMEELVENLFVLSNYDDGQYVLPPEKINIHSFLAEYLESSKAAFENSRTKAVLMSHANQQLYIRTAKKELTRVFNNLIENSIKYRERHESKIIFEIYGRENAADRKSVV